MSKSTFTRNVAMLLLITLCWVQPVFAQPQPPIVHAVMFYSPSCGHCHHVINEILPPLLEAHGEQFQIVGINIAEEGGQAMYQATIAHFEIPDERRGVPTLIIGETVLVGSGEIPEQLPGIIEDNLNDGLDWPAVPGLLEALTAETPPVPTNTPTTELEATPTTETAATEQTATPKATPTTPPEKQATPTPLPGFEGASDNDWRSLYARDPLGNSISVVVLLGLIGSAIYNLIILRRDPTEKALSYWRWAIPPLIVLGLIVAGYLAYVETQQVAAVCGPVGDCNAVQQSDFALLFGFLPIAVLGLMGYIAIGTAWGVARFASGLLADLAKLAMVGMAWFGICFSTYLTFLEPFIIGATCAWCLSSAVLMILLLWIIAPLARPTVRALQNTLAQSQRLTSS